MEAWAYIGWEKLTTDKSVVGIVSDAVIGEETTQKIGDTVSNIGEGMKEVKDSVTVSLKISMMPSPVQTANGAV